MKTYGSIFLLIEENYQKSITHKVKEEVFLMSFPSLNPYIVHHMISECSLHEIMNLTFDELLKRWRFIPERFLKCFYSTVHKVLPSESDASDETPESTPDSNPELNSKSNPEFKLKPTYGNVNDSRDYDDSDETSDNERFLGSELANIGQIEVKQHLCLSKNANKDLPSNKSLQELDLDYMSLKLSHEYDGYNDYLNEDSVPILNRTGFSINKCSVVSPRKNMYHKNDNSYNFESLNSQISNGKYSQKTNSICHDRALKKPEDRSNFLESSKLVTIGRDIFSSSNSKINDSQFGNSSMLDFEKFRYAPKRKFVTGNSSPNNDCLSSPTLKKSCRIQKGMISKTVRKNDLVYPSDFTSQDVVSCDSGNIKKVKVSPFMRRGNCFEETNKKNMGRFESENDEHIYFERRLSQWQDSSSQLKSLPMTPATRKLSYEKMPGVKGQTRLVFQ